MAKKKVETAEEAKAAAELKAAKRRKRKKITKTILKIVVILAAVAVAAFFAYKHFFGTETVANEGTTYTVAAVERRDIVEQLSGSGTLASANSYTVSARVSGDIIRDTFSEGDTVKKDDILYVIDSSDMDTNLEKAEEALADAKEAYEEKVADRADLIITAPISGVVSGLTVEEGDTVNKNSAVFTLKNISTLKITEYYSLEYKDKIYVGMNATVSVPAQMLNLGGKVSEVSDLTRSSETGVTCFAVTIEVQNPGSLSIGADATTWLAGDIYPSITSIEGFEASATKVVRSNISGDVLKVNASNGDVVTAGMTLIEFDGENLEDEIENALDAIEDAQRSLDDINESIDNYNITAPIDGTVVRKVLKAGESADGGSTLCMIYDMSYLTVELAVDELDISSVEVGQSATVTADAVENVEFEGVVTRVGVNGTTSGGVTTYPVEIRIDDIDGLLPGMNVDIVITVDEALDVLTIPVDAVERNNRVLVKRANTAAADVTAETMPEMTGEIPEGMSRPEGMDGEIPEGMPRPEGMDGEIPEGMSRPVGMGTANASGTVTSSNGLPEGYEYVTVEIGMSDEDYVEIISGLEEGDTVAYIPKTVTTSNNNFGMMMGNMGGMQMGGMPSGNRQSGGFGGGF
ncbi:MAG: HlyD family efflux transporter periplasmic adaptor subunit [Clostridia bacterium]|nr:HlyD family efflux transporter periplasmic adaptor subunit [Clostridia bacterium]